MQYINTAYGKEAREKETGGPHAYRHCHETERHSEG